MIVVLFFGVILGILIQIAPFIKLLKIARLNIFLKFSKKDSNADLKTKNCSKNDQNEITKKKKKKK